MADTVQDTESPAETEVRQRIARALAQSQQLTAPRYTAEQLAQRQADNQRTGQLGLLGMLSGDEGLGGVGGALYKQAQVERAPHVTDHGSFDPLTGQYTENPQFTQQRNLAEAGRLQDELAKITSRREDQQRLQTFQQQQNDANRALIAANHAATAGNAPLVAIVGPDGQPTLVPRAQAVGKAPAPTGGAGKMPAELQTMNVAFDALHSTINEYEDALKDFNPRSPTAQFDTATKAKFDALQSRLRIEAKEAARLGALSGPDLSLIDNMITNPATLRGAAYGTEGLTQQVQQARNWIEARRAAVAQQYPSASGQQPQQPYQPRVLKNALRVAGAPGGAGDVQLPQVAPVTGGWSIKPKGQ